MEKLKNIWISTSQSPGDLIMSIKSKSRRAFLDNGDCLCWPCGFCSLLSPDSPEESYVIKILV